MEVPVEQVSGLLSKRFLNSLYTAVSMELTCIEARRVVRSIHRSQRLLTK